MNGQNTHGVLRFESCSRAGIVGRFLAAAAFLTGISEIRQWCVRRKTTNIKSQGSGLPLERLESPDRRERELTMLRDQTTRSKLATRQPNDRDRDRLAPCLLQLEDQQFDSDAATAVVRPDRLMHGSDRHGGGEGETTALRAGHLDQ
jgi:hypothetical protein